MKVKWNDSCSDSFSLNGIRQGGVLIPLLFTVYMDGHLDRLKQSGIGFTYAGAFGYADRKVALLAPS